MQKLNRRKMPKKLLKCVYSQLKIQIVAQKENYAYYKSCYICSFYIASKLCPTDAQNLQQWQFNFNPQEEDQISQQGKEDMNLFARRVRTKFEELFGTEYSEQNFVVRALSSFFISFLCDMRDFH